MKQPTDDFIIEALPITIRQEVLQRRLKNEEADICDDKDLIDAIAKDIEETLGWKNFLGSTRSNLKFILPIIQRHLNSPTKLE